MSLKRRTGEIMRIGILALWEILGYWEEDWEARLWAAKMLAEDLVSIGAAEWANEEHTQVYLSVPLEELQRRRRSIRVLPN